MLRRAQASTSQIWSRIFGDAPEPDAPSAKSPDTSLECPVCWEDFNNSDHVPHVLWCGHSLCKSCVMGLQWASVKLPALPVQFPFFISCPWCQFLSCRFVLRGKLKFPSKNFFVLWMVQNTQDNKQEKGIRSVKPTTVDVPALPLRRNQQQHMPRPVRNSIAPQQEPELNESFLRRLFHGLTAAGGRLATKLAFLLVLLFILFYVLPIATFILLLYFAATLVFAFPSFIVFYFMFPSLGWLFREIMR